MSKITDIILLGLGDGSAEWEWRGNVCDAVTGYLGGCEGLPSANS